MLSFSQKILTITLKAYHELVSAIEKRIPNYEEAEQEEQRLASEETLDQGNFPKVSIAKAGTFCTSATGGFGLTDRFVQECSARSFLTGAQRPRKSRYIAPGIALPTEDTLTSQPFKELAKSTSTHHRVLGCESATTKTPCVRRCYFSQQGEMTRRFRYVRDLEHIPPRHYLLRSWESLLCERSDADLRTFLWQASLPSSPGEEHTFQYPSNSLHDVPAGLYFDMSQPWQSMPYEDASLLVLPFTIGGAT